MATPLTAEDKALAEDVFRRLAKAGAAEDAAELLRLLKEHFGASPNERGLTRSYHMALVAPGIVADWTRKAFKLDEGGFDPAGGDMVALFQPDPAQPAPGEQPAFQAMVACLNGDPAGAEAVVANEHESGPFGALTMMNQWLVMLATDALVEAQKEGVEL